MTGKLPITEEAEALAWLAKYAVTFYHGCDRHPGQWNECEYGPCGEMKRLGLTEVLFHARPVWAELAR